MATTQNIATVDKIVEVLATDEMLVVTPADGLLKRCEIEDILAAVPVQNANQLIDAINPENTLTPALCASRMLAVNESVNGHTVDLSQHPFYDVDFPVLQNSWEDYDAEVYGQFQIIRRGNVGLLQGFIKNGITTSTTLIATFPVGFRPEFYCLLNACCSGTGFARLILYPNGDLRVNYVASNAWLSISGLSFNIWEDV